MWGGASGRPVVGGAENAVLGIGDPHLLVVEIHPLEGARGDEGVVGDPGPSIDPEDGRGSQNVRNRSVFVGGDLSTRVPGIVGSPSLSGVGKSAKMLRPLNRSITDPGGRMAHGCSDEVGTKIRSEMQWGRRGCRWPGTRGRGEIRGLPGPFAAAVEEPLVEVPSGPGLVPRVLEC